MAADDKWYFTKEQLQNTPSRKCGLDADKELSYRQQAANFIQDMGQKLQVSQLCINTAIVYMHRFYMFHSFTHFPWNTIAAAAFFLAAKVEEQPRKLEHVIRIANHCLHREQPVVFDAKSEQYAAQSQDLVFNENVLLQTLGFDVAIDHPHTHVVRCCHLVRDFCALMHAKSLENVNSLKSSALKVNDCISASIDLSKTSYFMASNSLHLTTMCLQYKPTVVACFCIHLASKWSNWQIPKSNEGKDWYYYVDKTVTAELLEQLTSEFLKIFDKCPSRLKRKITSISNHNSGHNIDQIHAAATSAGSPFDPDSRKYHSLDTSKDCGGSGSSGGPTFHRSHHDSNSKQGLLATPGDGEAHKKPPRLHDQQQRADYREYREKKERERLEREKVAAAAAASSASSTSGGASSSHHKTSSSSTTSSNVTAGPSLQPSGNKHLTASGQSKQHHRLPTSGIDPAKMKMHHRPNDSSVHRDQHQKDMTNGRGERYIPQQQQQQQRSEAAAAAAKLELHSELKVQQQQQQQQQKVQETNKLPPKYDPNRHRRDLDAKYAAAAAAAHKSQQSAAAAITTATTVSSVNSSVLNDKQKTPVININTSQNTQNTQNNSSSDNKNFLNKQINSTSQRHKSPLFSEMNKPSVPNATTTTTTTSAALNLNINVNVKSESRNGNTDINKTSVTTAATSWPPQDTLIGGVEKLDEGLLSPPPPITLTTTTTTTTTKKSSLFSPEKTPPQPQPQQPQQKKWNTRTPPPTVPPPISPFGSPPPIQSHPKLQTPTSLRRSRTCSSGSEPELRPVVKKLDQISGFENIIRDSKMGIKLPKVPDIIQPICDRAPPGSGGSGGSDKPPNLIMESFSKELKVPEIIKPFTATIDPQPVVPVVPVVNGIETDPAAISTLLKEVVTIPTTTTDETSLTPAIIPIVEHQHHHKSEKKKKKDKHKHKDKDKGRDEKKKKHKDKDKDRRNKDKLLETSQTEEVPLKITISKKNVEQITTSTSTSTITDNNSLKVKISRDKIKPDSIQTTEPLPPNATNAPSTLKIKISKDQIQYVDNSSSNNGRKRDRGAATATPPGIPPTKIMKSSYGGGRQNGKNYYNNKVLQIGEGDSTHLRLAESKYQSKGASKTS